MFGISNLIRRQTWESKPSNDEGPQAPSLSTDELMYVMSIRERGSVRAFALNTLDVSEQDLKLIQKTKEFLSFKDISAFEAFMRYSIARGRVSLSGWDEARALKAIRRIAQQGLYTKADLYKVVKLCFILFRERFSKTKTR